MYCFELVHICIATLFVTRPVYLVEIRISKIISLLEQELKRVHLLRPHIVESNKVGGDTFLDLSLPLHSCLKLVRLLLEILPPVRAALKGVLPPPGFHKAAH